MACCLIAALFIHRSMKALQALNLIHTTNQQEIDSGSGLEKASMTIDDEVVELEVLRLNVSGTSCSSCWEAISAAITPLTGIHKITTSVLMNSATIVFDPRLLEQKTIRSLIHRVGYQTSLRQDWDANKEALDHMAQLQKLRNAFRGAAICAAISWSWRLGLRTVTNHEANTSNLLYILCSLLPVWVAQTWFTRNIHLSAWRQGTKINMDTLISTSLLLSVEFSIASLILSDPKCNTDLDSNNAFLATVVLGGRYLTQALRVKGVSHISAFRSLQQAVPEVCVLPDHVSTPKILVRPGARILVPCNSVIPCDGYIVKGASLVDQSFLTGESIPASKKEGDLVMSGTSNLSSPLEVIVTCESEESSVSRMFEAISRSTETEKSDILPVLSPFTSHFSRGVMTLAVLAFIVETLFNLIDGAGSLAAIHAATCRATTILAVACPCGMGLAIPTATMAGLRACATRGILVKGGLETMAKLCNLTHIAFDKTGTVTQASLKVSGVCISGIAKEEFHLLVCSAERDAHVEHIIGRALFQWAFAELSQENRENFERHAVRDLKRLDGRGVVGKIQIGGKDGGRQWREVVVGSDDCLRELAIEPVFTATSPRASHIVHVAIDGIHVGYVSLADVVKPEAAATIQDLQQRGLKVKIVTGDTHQEAIRVGNMLNLTEDDIVAGALPWEKEDLVRKIQEAGGNVAMVGDGANDLQAQAASNISVAICAENGLGASVALSSASDVTIISTSGLHAVHHILDIARQTVWQAKFNLVWAIAYNTAGILLATGLLEPIGLSIDVSMAGIMMAMSSIIVLLLSQRIQ